jgi:hypothetical protein
MKSMMGKDLFGLFNFFKILINEERHVENLKEKLS